MNIRPSILLTGCCLFALAACSSGTVKETLGIGAKAPDEFRVVSRPPLSVPPQFNLRPPSSNAASPTVVPADKQARSIVTGTEIVIDDDSENLENSVVTAKKKQKSANEESAFMKNIGADRADPRVREELVQQKIAEQEKQEEDSWWSKITRTGGKKDTLVDAKKEAQRIKTNKEENKAVTEGETPEVKDKDHGLLGNIFGW